MRSVIWGFTAGVVVGLLGPTLDGGTVGFHTPGNVLLSIGIQLFLAGAGACVFGWLQARRQGAPAEVWRRGVAFSVSALIGLATGLAGTVRILGMK